MGGKHSCPVANQPGVQHRLHDLPILWHQGLVQDHAERLALFQVNRALTAIILQHAPSIQLTLAPLSNSTARAHAMEQILASAPEALLKVHVNGCFGDVCTMWSGSIKQHVSHLTLSNCVMTGKVLQTRLQLQQCSHLQTLVLKSMCQAPGPLQQLKTLAQHRTSILPPTLTHLDVQFNSSEATADLIHLAGPQITHLTCTTMPQPCPLEQLGQLTHISLNLLDDTAMTCLLQLPRLTHVTAVYVRLEQDHSSKQLGWEQLQLEGGNALQHLQPLPLPSIKQLVLRSCISCGQTVSQQCIAHLASCPSLQCIPTQRGLPHQVEFSIIGVPDSNLISLCANGMTCSGGMHLVEVQLPAMWQLLPCIASLPSKVESLRLRLHCDSQHWSRGQQLQALQQLVDALPKHMRQLVLHYNDIPAADTYSYVEAVVGRLQSSQRSTKLLVASSYKQGAPYNMRALAKAHSEHLQCIQVAYERLSWW